jgi:hypothetical protein
MAQGLLGNGGADAWRIMNDITTLMHLLAQPYPDPVRIVIPVRYVARDRVVHATSLALTEEQVQVRSAPRWTLGTFLPLVQEPTAADSAEQAARELGFR